MEFIAVLFAAILSGSVWVVVILRQRFSPGDPASEIRDLQRHAMRLQRQLEIARRENWDVYMTSRIIEDLTNTSHQLARAGVDPFAQ